MSTEDWQPTIIHLPGTPLSPEVVLHRTLTKVGRIKAVATIIMWDDDTFDFDWSRMKLSELCMASMLFSAEVLKTTQPD